MYLAALLFLLLQAAQTTTPPAQTEQPKATLRGRVFTLDTGAPIKRAQVTLRGSQRQNDPQGAATDAQGAFEFKNVDPGTYTISCSKTGFVTASYGQKDPSRPGTPITVAVGQEIKDLTIRLMRGGVISGVISDEDGEPVANVNVQAMVRVYRRGQSQVTGRGSASTDDRGQYRIFNLPPGRYFIQAQQRSNFNPNATEEAVGYAPIFYPNALSYQDAQRVDVANGAEVPRVDLIMRSVPTYSISGKVIDGASGKPLAEGFVAFIGGDIMTLRIGGANGMIRPDGAFRLSGLLPGKGRLLIVVPARGNTMSTAPFTKAVEIGAANITDMQVVITPGVAVRGRIVAEGGTPPDNMRVTLVVKSEGGQIPFGGGSGVVNKDLTFEVDNIQPGDYEIDIIGSPFTAGTAPAPYYVREVRKGSENVLEKGLTVGEAPVGDVEVILDFQPGTVAGRATDEDGNAVTGTTVVLLSTDPKKRGQERYFKTGNVDQTGNFKVTGVIPGDYLALLWPASDASPLQDPDLFGPLQKHAVSVSVDKGATANQDLKVVTEVKTVAQNSGQ